MNSLIYFFQGPALHCFIRQRLLIVTAVMIMAGLPQVIGQPSDLNNAFQYSYNMDAGYGDYIGDYPLLDVVVPNSYRLSYSEDGKSYILIKIRGLYEEVCETGALSPLGMPLKPQVDEIAFRRIAVIDHDPAAFLMAYNEKTDLLPAHAMAALATSFSGQLYPLFSGRENYRITKNRNSDQGFSLKIISSQWKLKLRFNDEGELVDASQKTRFENDQDAERDFIRNYDEYLARNLVTDPGFSRAGNSQDLSGNDPTPDMKSATRKVREKKDKDFAIKDEIK